MSRHRNIRNRAYSYDEDYYDEDEYDDDEYYGEPGSPTSRQFVWQGNEGNQSLSHFVLDDAIGNAPSKSQVDNQPAPDPKTAPEEPTVDPMLLLDLQTEIEGVLGREISMSLVKEAGKACQYESEAMTQFILEQMTKKDTVELIPPSRLGGKKIHVIRSSSAPDSPSEANNPQPQTDVAAGSVFAQALSSSSKPNLPPGLAVSVSEGTVMQSSDVTKSGIQPFKFDEPSPDEIQSRRGGRKQPVVKASEITKKTAKISLGNRGTSASSSTTQSSKKKKPVITDHVEHGTDKTLMHMVVIGHVDAGKSTIMGHLLYKMKVVGKKEMHKFTKESKEMGKASFSYAWVMDAHDSERERGVTMDVGVKHFETENKRVAVLDAPGHKDFIPNMITGAAQADVAVLVVPATASEFQSAFRRDGQTREHALLVRSFGVQQLVVAINKMDMCDWSQTQYEAVKSEVLDFLIKQSGFLEKNIRFVPLSGLAGLNLTTRVDKTTCSWYDGPSLVEAIDTFEPTQRPSDKPVRFPLHDVFKGFGSALMVAGKLEAGTIEIGDDLLVAPTTEVCTVKTITSGSLSVTRARAGENIEVCITGVDMNLLFPGNILCSTQHPIPVVERFEARVSTLSMMKIPMLCGSKYTMHIQSLDIPVVVVKLTELVEPTKKLRPRHLTRGQAAIVEIETSKPVCMELFKDYRPFGRFLLRSRSSTDATGMVTKIVRLAAPLSEK